MVIKQYALKHWIDNFYGYGSWKSRFWFVALEESGGDSPDEVAEKLDYFHSAPCRSTEEYGLCDIREMYKHIKFRDEGSKAGLYKSHYDFRFGDKAVQNGFWKNLAAFAFGTEGKELPDLLEYQKRSLTTTGHEALIKLYPLPAHNHAWYYSWLDMPELPFLKTRTAYEAEVFDNRLSHIMRKLKTFTPEVMLMYGMENINQLKTAICSNFPATKFESVKSTKLVIPQHHRASVGSTRLIITTQIPGLRHGRKETGFDWYRFGQSVREAHESQTGI